MTSPQAPLQITAIGDDDVHAFERAVALGFGESPSDEEIAHQATLTVPERTLAARDGERIVGTAFVMDFELTLPWAAPVPCAGVTSVSVRPTHRRRGILTGLMRRQLDDLHATGQPWAALYASEAAIYGRFGYGMATRSFSARIDRPWTRFERPVAPADVDLLTIDEAVERVPPIYDAVRRTVPGMMSSSVELWRHHLRWDPHGERDGASERYVAAIGDRAYALYRLKRGWGDTGPDGTARVEECLATDPQAQRQMWTFLFGIDLVQHAAIDRLAIDDPLPWWLAERRRLRLVEGMSLYARLVDVGAALSLRGTRAGDALTLEVTDVFCPWNQRRWLLEGDGGRLRCTPTDAAADVRLDARGLASLSLGGVSAGELHRADLLEVTAADVIGRLDALLAAERSPFNAFTF